MFQNLPEDVKILRKNRNFDIVEETYLLNLVASSLAMLVKKLPDRQAKGDGALITWKYLFSERRKRTKTKQENEK